MSNLDKQLETMPTSQRSPAPKVYGAICSVMAELRKEGIGKDRKNAQQGYNFRGIDDVYNALSGALVDAGLVILPSFSDRQVVERETKTGGALFNVTVQATFTLICADDGSKLNAGPFFGEAMDSADKATNKAMSAAYKYMAMEVFCIPTQGDNDADATTHEVKATRGSAREVTQEAFNALSAGDQEAMRTRAQTIAEIYAAKGITDAVDYYHDLGLDQDGKLALWFLLDSTMRSNIKREEARRSTLKVAS